jgi:hypothetical protein
MRSVLAVLPRLIGPFSQTRPVSSQTKQANLAFMRDPRNIFFTSIRRSFVQHAMLLQHGHPQNVDTRKI